MPSLHQAAVLQKPTDQIDHCYNGSTRTLHMLKLREGIELAINTSLSLLSRVLQNRTFCTPSFEFSKSEVKWEKILIELPLQILET